MRVGINARLLSSPGTRGWNRYAVNLMVELQRLGCELILYSEQPVHRDHLRRLDTAALTVRESGRMLYLRWEQVWLPMAMRRDGLDVFHSPFHFGLPVFSPCPRVLTLHDAIGHVRDGKKAFSVAALMSDFYQWTARKCADRIVTVSEHAKSDLVKHLRLRPEAIRVIHNAADPSLLRSGPEVLQSFRERNGIDGRFLFYAGGWEERKNVGFLVKAFARASADDLELVLSGGTPAEIAQMRDLAEIRGVSSRVILLGRISEAELAALYGGCHCFVYPSLYEGFGLQLCEAMLAGARILSSNATSLPEVLASGGALFDPTCVDELAQLIRRVSTDTAFCEDLSRRSRARCGAFGWDRAAAATVQVYESAVAATRRAAVAL